MERFRKLPVDPSYDVYLGQYFEPHGALPGWLEDAIRINLRFLLQAHASQLWFSRPFWMPSLGWRSEHPRHPHPPARTAGSQRPDRHNYGSAADDPTQWRWAVALLVCERQGVEPCFTWWSKDPYPTQDADPDATDGVGRPARYLGFLLFDPEVFFWPGNSRNSTLPKVVEAHLNSPTCAHRGAWHVIENICGIHYGLSPFRGTSLFFQRGHGRDCVLVACMSSLLITRQRIGGRPLGINELIGNAVNVVLHHPVIADLPGTHRRLAGIEVQHYFEQWDSGKDDLEARLRRIVDQGIAAAGDREPDLNARFQRHGLWGTFEIVSLALRSGFDPSDICNAPSGLRERPPSRGSGDGLTDFNCSAVVEFVRAQLDGAPPGGPQNDLTQEPVKSLLVDYLSDGYPVVARVDPGKLQEYQWLMRRKSEDLKAVGVPPIEGQVGNGEHAFLILGYHWARPCEVEANERLPGNSADAFVVSDLCHTHLLNVDANAFCKALTQRFERRTVGDGAPSLSSDSFVELFVILPKGVRLSAGEARKCFRSFFWGRSGLASEVEAGLRLANSRRAVELLAARLHLSSSDVAERDKPILALRTALFSADRALQRYHPVIPTDSGEASQTWKDYCAWALERAKLGSENADSTATSFFWNVELHGRWRESELP